MFGALVLADPDFIKIGEGFCDVSFESVWYFPLLALFWLLQIIFLSVILVFSILTLRYVRKTTITENSKIKKATARVLLFFLIVSFLDVVGMLFPSFLPVILEYLDESSAGVIFIALTILYTVFFIPQVLIPIVMIIILKPLREALVQGQRRIVSYFKSQTRSTSS